jgi:hypothetical protein
VAGYRPPALVNEAVRRFEECRGAHQTFVSHYERMERGYLGILRSASNAAKWRHKLHPMYAYDLIEGVVANTVEMGLSFDVRPAPHVNVGLEEATKMLSQAEAIGDLLRHEYRIDDMDYKQRPLFLTASICGTGVLKSYWNYENRPGKRQALTDQPVHDEQGNEIMRVPVLTEVDTQMIRDHSTAEVCDPRDVIMHEAARALQPTEPGGAQYIFHRTYYSFEQLKMMEAAGFLSNVDRLKDAEIDFSADYKDRETSLWKVNRTKDMIEVLEYWCFKNGQVWRSWIGNRAILLRDEEASPYQHGGYPFAICSTMPKPFSTKGIGDMELIQHLQEMLWEIQNQRFDNLELVNNFITLIRSDLDDEAFPFYPGARWPVDGDVNSAMMPLQPPYQVAEASIHAEALLKGDLQQVTAAAPFATGADTQTVDQKTATGASMVMNVAQQRLAFKKYMAQQGLKDEANMRIKNCQQFITEDRLVHILGEDGAQTFKQISPVDIQGEFIAELEPMGESQMRQEKRAEAIQIFQVLAAAAPLMAAAGTPLNMREVSTYMLKKWGIDDADRFFSQQPAAQGAMAMPGQSGPPQGPPQAGPTQPNLGITAGAAIDAGSPSAAGGISGSPVAALQRALTLGGGPNNQ